MPRLPIDRLTCTCGRRFSWDTPDVDQWNAVMQAGVAVGVLCPNCQTPAENLEAEVNAATTDYHLDTWGRVRGNPKAEG